jgi:hypothetical protein
MFISFPTSICRDPSFGRECEDEDSHSQVSSHFGSWSLSGLPNLQRATTGVKTPCIEDFFITLKSYSSVDVQNGLTWPIRTSLTQVMAKRKLESQIGSLTFDHKKSRINPTSVRAGGVQHTVGNLSMRATSLLQTSSGSEVWTRIYSREKLWES